MVSLETESRIGKIVAKMLTTKTKGPEFRSPEPVDAEQIPCRKVETGARWSGPASGTVLIGKL